MDTLYGLFGGGLVLLVGLPLALMLFLVLPWWALIDVIRRKDNTDTRVVWGVFLVLLWGLTSVFYALFSTRSRGLRVTMIVCLIGCPLAVVGGFASVHRASQIGAARSAEEAEQLRIEFRPQTIDPGTLQPVLASRSVEGSNRFQVGLFGLEGPAADSLRPVTAECTWVTLDTRRQQHYCLSWRALTRIDFEDELTTEITPSSDEDFGHFGGLTYDEERDRIIVAANSGAGGLFAYDPGTDRWSKLAVPGDDFHALTWAAEDEVYYGIPRTVDRLLRKVRRYNVHGALVDEIDLDPQIPVKDGNLQLVWGEGWLHVVLPEHDFIYAVDPESGAVYAAG